MATPIEDYERSLIGSLLMNPDNIAVAESLGVNEGFFTVDMWSLAWTAIHDAWKRGVADGVTPFTLAAEVRRLAAGEKEKRSPAGMNAAAIQAAIADATPGSIEVNVHLLRNYALERSAKSAVTQSWAEFDRYADSADVLLMARGKLDAILSKVAEQKKIAPRAVMEEIMAEYREAHAQRVDAEGPRNLKWTPGIKMPWPKITETMNGLRAGLHVIAARPSVGKTSFAINLMRFWCEIGVPVTFCSLDMPRVEVVRRFVAERSRVSARKAAFSPTRDDLAAMDAATDAIAQWPLSIVEIRDVDELRTHCMIEQSAGRLGVLVVDYLQLLHARALGREDAVEYARVSYVSDTLKRLANELHVPVVALAQLNREVTKQDAAGRLPGLADLRGSGSIEQDAFTVAILHRDDATVAKWKSGENNERALRLIPGTLENPNYNYNLDDIDPVWWILCKAQNGPTGKMPFVVRKKYFAWMLGDWKAEPNRQETGHGATARTVVDNSPLFERVHSDWRHDAIEETLRLQLALIQDSDDVQNQKD